MVIKNGTDDILTRERRIVMVRFGKKAALLAMAGVLTAASVTGCSGSIDAEGDCCNGRKGKGSAWSCEFYARMMQGQYETYYAG